MVLLAVVSVLVAVVDLFPVFLEMASGGGSRLPLPPLGGGKWEEVGDLVRGKRWEEVGRGHSHAILTVCRGVWWWLHCGWL